MNPIKTLLTASLLSINTCAFAVAPEDSDVLLTNLGAYLGYEITSEFEGTPYAAMLDATASAAISQNMILSVFGAIPVNAITKALGQFMPTSESSGQTTSTINNYSNATFLNASYSSPSSQGSININPLIDQETYQNDPTNQALLNILGTPDYTFCMNNDATAWLSECDYLYNYNVTNNIVGAVPTAANFFSYAYNQDVLPQINSNTLVAPLLYDTDSSIGTNNNTNSSGSSSNTSTNTTNAGLTASTQLQAAANFIRYVTFGTSPVSLPSYQDYTAAYATAISTTAPPKDVADAKNAINSYIANLRTYASLTSVPISNLYAILSKRMPQNPPSSSSQTQPPSSQAVNEFIMATRRLNSSGSGDTTAWLPAINTASPATVEKEIALLLAEINYQLYLNRQQDERQLLTTSLILMVLARQQMPNFQTTTTTPSTSTTGG